MNVGDFVKVDIEKVKISKTYISSILTNLYQRELNYLFSHPNDTYVIKSIIKKGNEVNYILNVNGYEVAFTKKEIIPIEKELIFNNHIKDEKHYGTVVKTNEITDKMRRNECMCLYCQNLHPGEDDNCLAAQSMYNISVDYDCAMMMTRCRNYKPGKYFDGRKRSCED